MDSIIYSKVFWGVVVLLIGISIITQAVFKIDIPIFKIVVGLFLLFMGVKVLTGAFGISTGPDSSSSIFSSQNIHVEHLVDGSEYSSVFGSQQIDFTMVSRTPGTYRIECNTVFGSCEIIIPNDVEVSIEKNAVFASVKTPGGGNTHFGEGNYSSGNSAPTRLEIEANAVFGSIEIHRR